MNSDSESQDSDEGRRFRFEATRKDSIYVSQSRRKVTPKSPQHNRRTIRRSRSRNRSFRDERLKHLKGDFSRKSRLSNEKDTNNKHLVKDKCSKDIKNINRYFKSRRQHDKDSRSFRIKDFRNYDSKVSRDIKVHTNCKHKNKSREKHKRHSKDKSRERNNEIAVIEEVFKKEEKKSSFETAAIAMEMKELQVERKKIMKKQYLEDKKVNYNNMDKVIESDNSNSIAISDIVESLTSTMVNTTEGSKKLKSIFDTVVNKTTRDVESSLYGPALPLKLEKKCFNDKHIKIQNMEIKELPSQFLTHDNQQINRPFLSKNLILSTVHTNNIMYNKKEENTKEEKRQIKKKKEDIGSVLPHCMERNNIIGPMLPNNIISSDKMCVDKTYSYRNEKDNNDIIGPLPIDHPAIRESYGQIQLEYRATHIKTKLTNKTSSKINKREEWMLELPPTHPIALNLDSIPRKFKVTQGPDMSDRSIWTDTPADKTKKKTEKEGNRFVQSELQFPQSNNSLKKNYYESTNIEKETTEEINCESLLDMHLKTLKRKKKKLEKETSGFELTNRRPFDRNIDLQINQLDVRKKQIFEKANKLNDRFTTGKI